MADPQQVYKDLRNMALHATDVITAAGPVAAALPGGATALGFARQNGHDEAARIIIESGGS